MTLASLSIPPIGSIRGTDNFIHDLTSRVSIPVSIKHGLRTTDCGLRTTDYGLRTTDYGLAVKHGLRYKTRTKHYGLSIKYGLEYKTRINYKFRINSREPTPIQFVCGDA